MNDPKSTNSGIGSKRKNSLTPEQRKIHWESNKKWRKNNPEKWKEVKYRYYKKHISKHREWTRKGNAKRLKKIAEYGKRWAKNNPEKIRASSLRYREKNKEKIRERYRQTKLRNIGLLHPSRNECKISLIYEAAKIETAKTGIKWEVDHIIPLCLGGWHHELNLQILPRFFNREKSGNPVWKFIAFKDWRDVPKFLWPEALRPKYEALEEEAKNRPRFIFVAADEYDLAQMECA